MQNPTQKLTQSFIVFDTRYFVWKIGNFDELQLPQNLTILVEMLHNFSTFQWVFGTFFCLDLELFAKIKKDLVSTDSQKPGLSTTQHLNKIKKSRTSVDRHYKQEACAKFQKKVLKSMIVELVKVFNFPDK